MLLFYEVEDKIIHIKPLQRMHISLPACPTVPTVSEFRIFTFGIATMPASAEFSFLRD